jgi:hypothetical protein
VEPEGRNVIAIEQLETSFKSFDCRPMLPPEDLHAWASRLETVADDRRHGVALGLVRMAARIHRSEPVHSTEAVRQLALLTGAVLKSRELALALFRSAGLPAQRSP